jgi:hypothetical protein
VQCNVRSFLLVAPSFELIQLVARKIPFDDPLVLNYVRIGYVLSQIIMLGAYYYVSIAVRILLILISPHLITLSQIKRKNDQTVLKYGKLASSM